MHEDTGGSTDPTPSPRLGNAESTAETQLAGVLHALPELYQYCWSLLGPGSIDERTDQPPGARLSGACAAVWEAALTAVDRQEDWAATAEALELRVWLFALARAACQRKGWLRDSPYSSVVPTGAERVTAALMNQLAPSQRELLELTLRHGLSPAQVSVVVGLDPASVTRLAEAAIVRSREIVAAAGVELEGTATPSGTASDATSDAAQLRARLTGLAPPHPPAQLRAMIQLACTSPEQAAARRAATNRLGPYGNTLLPQHRGPGPAGTAPASGHSTPDEVGTASDPHERPVGHTVRNPVATDIPPVRATHGRERPARRYWVGPVAAGLCTVVVALTVWATAAFLDGPRVVAAPPNELPTVTSPTTDTDVVTEHGHDAGDMTSGDSQDEAPGDTASTPDSATEAGDSAAEEPSEDSTAPETDSERKPPGDRVPEDRAPEDSGTDPDAEGTAEPSIPGSPSTAPPAEEDDAQPDGSEGADEDRRGLLGGLADTVQGLLGRD